VRCHLGVAPQERTAEEHTTRGPRTTLTTFGRVTLGGTVSRDWSLSTVPCEGGTCLAPTLTTSGSQQKSSTSYWLESMDADILDCSARWRSLYLMARCARCDVRWETAVFVASDETTASDNQSALDAFRRLLLQIGGANVTGADRATKSFDSGACSRTGLLVVGE
jgi:hypothetical protein